MNRVQQDVDSPLPVLRTDGAATREHVHAGSFADTSTIEQRLADDPVHVGRLVARFALAGACALLIVGVITAWASQRVGNDQAIADARRVNEVSARGIIEPNLTEALLAPPAPGLAANTPADPLEVERVVALNRLDTAIRRTVLTGSLVRVKLWRKDGVVVYSDEPRLIGEQFTLADDKLEVFDTGLTSAEVSELDAEENRFETESKLLEVYTLVKTPAGTPLLMESYFRYSGVAAVGRDLWAHFAPIAIGSLIALEVVQIPLAWSMARRLRAGQRDRERLLRRAIDASETERRRIASDLHDGVVQDLTGVSLSLTAAHRQGTTQDVVPDSADRIRSSIKSLRSLLVEIYPQNLHDEGLGSALGDLLSAVSNRGIHVELDIDPGINEACPQTVTLLYRVAQEALRNVASHSMASTVAVFARLATDREPPVAELTVEDDGRGFGQPTLDERVRDGHVGLRALGGLVADAGGQLTIRSAPGRGTSVQVHAPLTNGRPGKDRR